MRRSRVWLGAFVPLLYIDKVCLCLVCLGCIGHRRFLDVSLVCIGHLRLCARQLAEGGVDVALQVRPKTKGTGFFGTFPCPACDAPLVRRRPICCYCDCYHNALSLSINPSINQFSDAYSRVSSPDGIRHPCPWIAWLDHIVYCHISCLLPFFLPSFVSAARC